MPATAATYATAAASVTQTWTNPTDANGSTTGTYATRTSTTSSETAVIELSGYGFQSLVPADATIDSVVFTIRHLESSTSVISSVLGRAYVGTVAKGAGSTTLTKSTTVREDSFTLTGVLTWADLADLRCRYTANRGAVTTSAVASLDRIGIVVNYTEAPYTFLANTGFEWDSNSDGLADGWNKYGTPTCTLDATTFRSGTVSQKMVTPNGSNQDIHFNLVPITAGTAHALSVWANVAALGAGGQFTLKVEWHDAAGALVNYDYTVVSAVDAAFTRRTVTSTPGAGATVALIVLAIEGLGGGTVYYDEIQLEQGAAATTYVEPDIDWMVRAIMTESTAVGAGGAIGLYIDRVSIRPYEASYAAIGFAAAYRQLGVQRFADAAWAWCAWYAAHMEPNGTMYDYNIVGGTLTKLSTRDSTDSYAGMFLLALRAAYIVDPRSLSGYVTAIGKAVDAIELTLQPDGLTFALPTTSAKYMQNQTETLLGLRAAVNLSVATSTSTVIVKALYDAKAMTSGIEAMWNAGTAVAPAYDWAKSDVGVRTTTTWGTYGDALQQAWVVIFNISESGRSSALMTQFVASQPNWAHQETVGRYDALIAVALLRTGSTAAAKSGLDTLYARAVANARAYDYNPMKAGWQFIARANALDLLYLPELYTGNFFF